MFYTGAITYKPNPSLASLQHNFRIPNRITEREFITEALKIYDWKKEDLIPVRNCLQILEAEYNIEPLCRFIEKALLQPLKDNSVKHSNEEALKQAFMDTLILTLHAEIEPAIFRCILRTRILVEKQCRDKYQAVEIECNTTVQKDISKRVGEMWNHEESIYVKKFFVILSVINRLIRKEFNNEESLKPWEISA